MRSAQRCGRSTEEIVAAGFILQIDCPDLAMGRHSRFKHLDDAEFLRCAEIHVEALNDAVANIPADRMRMHVCWGNYEGPHTHDVPLQTILPVVLKARPSMLLIEAANPVTSTSGKYGRVRNFLMTRSWSRCHRHQHELRGTPELVAQRIARLANIVGRERVIAGTDCGMGTFAGFGPVHPEIAWAKLRSLTRGAELSAVRLAKQIATLV